MGLKRIPNPDDDAALWVADANHPFWDALSWVDTLGASGYAMKPVVSVESMVRTAQFDTIGNGRILDFIAIFGHGTEGYQGLGCGREYETTGERCLRFEQMAMRGGTHLSGAAARKLSSLNGVLSNHAELLLAGCSVGSGSYGSGLLTTISSLLKNRAVHAFTNDVYWWTGSLIGTLKTARGKVIATSFAILPLGKTEY